MPAGGIMPVRSRRTTFSQLSRFCSTRVASIPCSTSPPLGVVSLWQPMQYRSRTPDNSAGDPIASAADCAAPRASAAGTRPAPNTIIEPIAANTIRRRHCLTTIAPLAPRLVEYGLQRPGASVNRLWRRRIQDTPSWKALNTQPAGQVTQPVYDSAAPGIPTRILAGGSFKLRLLTKSTPISIPVNLGRPRCNK